MRPPEARQAGIRIARLVAEQAPAYSALMLQAYAREPAAFTSTPEERAALPPSWWAARIADPHDASLVLGAFDGDVLVGAVTLEFPQRAKTRHKAHLVGMVVQPPARGRGAGRALVQAALAAAAARPGLRLVTLTVTEGNAAALALYTACGFRPFGTEPLAVCVEGAFLGKVHMAAVLEQPGSAGHGAP